MLYKEKRYYNRKVIIPVFLIEIQFSSLIYIVPNQNNSSRLKALYTTDPTIMQREPQQWHVPSVQAL